MQLAAATSNRLPPRFGGESENDIFLLIKAFVSDADLCQEPLLVWPGSRAQSCADALQRIARNQVPGD